MKNPQIVDVEETLSSTSSSSQFSLHSDQNMNPQNHQPPPQSPPQQPPLDKEQDTEKVVEVEVEEEGEEKHNTLRTAPFLQLYSPRQSHSPSWPSDSPPHSIPQTPEEETHQTFQTPEEESHQTFQTPETHQTYQTHEFRVTPADTRPASPPAVPPRSFRAEESGGGGTIAGGDGVKKRNLRPSLSILKRSRKESTMRRALFGLRMSGFVFCLISLSVMAADNNKGWALDSFHRYKELRYCLSVNVLGFVYSGLQTFDLAYYFTTGKHVMQHHFRHYFDFLLDQILTYLLMSASSSAAIRVDDWESNWGKDKFPDMARASVALSFLAFVTFAFSSLISGYTLCTLKSI